MANPTETVNSSATVQAKASKRKKILYALAIVALVGCAGLVFVALNWRSLGASAFNRQTRKLMVDAPLPEKQKEQILARLEVLSDDFKNQNITYEEFNVITRHLQNSPLMSMGMVMFFDQTHIQSSGLSDQEKSQATRTLQRVARGVIETSLKPAQIHELTTPLMEKVKGKLKLKANLSDEQLRSVLAQAKLLADEANIPDEAFEMDMAMELDKAIKQGLKIARQKDADVAREGPQTRDSPVSP